MTARLPIIGGDNGDWGQILNTFLEVAHNSDGTLQPSALQTAGGVLTSQVGAPNGVASLNGSGQVPVAQLGSGTGSTSTYLRGDGSWAAVAGGSSTLASDTDVSISNPSNNQLLTYDSTTSKWVNQTATAAQVGALASTANLSTIASANATSGSVSMNSNKITNLANGSASTDAAALGQIPTSASSIGGLLASNNLSDVADTGTSRANIHLPTLTPAACVATSNVTLSGFQTIDGYTLVSGDLVLLTGQTTASQNGLWTAASGTWTRPTEFATGIVVKGKTCSILNGTTYKSTSWLLNAPTAGITVDTTSQTWTNQSAAGGSSYVASPTSTTNKEGYEPLVITPSGATQWGMPWQFNVMGYGAKGNGICVTDGSMTSGSAVLTCATSAPFSSSDVGKAIMVKYAVTAATGSTLVTTIASFQSASQVTLSASATNTISSATVLYGTDDTTSIQNAINAAVTYAQSHGQYAEVILPPTSGAFYAVAGALVQGATTKGNAQLTLPIIAPSSAKVTLIIKGGENGGAVRYWNQTYPAFNGPTIVSFGVFGSASLQSSSITTNGNAAVIGGPTGSNGYGTGPGTPTYSNMMLTIKGLTLLTTHSANGLTYGAVNGYGVACVNLFDVSYGTVGVVLLTNGGGDFGSVSVLSSGISLGILMPSNGNNDSNQVRNVVCQGGYTYGFFATEHTDIHGMTMLYCWSGLCLVGAYGDYNGSSIGALHAIHASQVSIEACSYHINIIGAGSAGIGPIFNGVIDTEGSIQMRDTTSGTSLNAALGVMRIVGSPSGITLTAGTGMQIFKEQQLSGPATTPTYSLNTAQINTFWRPATVYVSGGTNITSIQVSNLAGGASAPTLTTIYSQTAGALPQMSFRVGPGQWWVINASTGTAPTMQWILD